MKKIIRKGFSIIELIFVIIILAALAAIAIPSMSSGTESDLTSMRSDMKSIIPILQSKYADEQDYTLIIPSYITNAVADESTGLYDLGDLKIPLKEGNMIDIKVITNEGTCTNKKDSELVDNGFEIKIYNKKIPNKALKFNSCTDTKIELIDIK